MKAELTVNVRPVRHTYFIGENDLERFAEVACFCSTQWGGINNLIIPVRIAQEAHVTTVQIHPYLESIMKRRSPDVFIDAVSGKEEDSSIYDAFNRYLTSEYPRKGLYQWEPFTQIDYSLHSLNILSPQRDSTRPELEVPGGGTEFSPPRSKLDDAILDAAFGRIWPGQKKDYDEAYTLREWNTSFPDKFLHQQLLVDPYASVINLTLKDLHNIGTEYAFPSLFFDVVIVQNTWDLCQFWNLRAQSFGHHWLVDRRILVLSKEQLFQGPGAYFEPLVRLLRERRSHSHIESNIDVIFHHYHDPEIYKFIQSHNAFQRHEGPLQTTMHDEREEGSLDTTYRPIIYEEDAITDFGVYHEYGGNRPTFSQELVANAETFLVSSSGPRTNSIGEAYIGLQSDFWQQFPNHPSVANLIALNSSFDVFLNTIQLSYKLMFPPQGLERLTINIPNTWDIYQAYFRSKGYEVSPSDKMPYSNGLVSRAGGLDQEKAQVLRSRIAREILDFLTDKATTKLAREIIHRLHLQSGSEDDLQRIITDLGILPQKQRVPKAFGDIFSHIKSIPELSNVERKVCLQILAQLVEIKVIQRGMYIKCPHCGTKSWYGILILDEQIRCSGCLELFDLPLTENVDDEVERSFQYSLNSLANQAMDQDVLPVIAALLTLKTHQQTMHHIVMGMNFQKVSNTKRDGDFDFIYTYKHELYGGECKSGGKFTIKDINTAKIAQILGFRAFFFVAMRPVEADGQKLIDDYQQELASNRDNEHPFSVFVLNDRVLFGEEPLPSQIPQ